MVKKSSLDKLAGKLQKEFLGEERKNRRKIPKGVRESVWNTYIGKDKIEGKCYVCERTIRITNFEVGHNKALSKGGSDRKSNLRPICRKCNSSMGTMSIEAYKRKYYSKPLRKKTKKRAKKSARRRRTKTPMERLAEKAEKMVAG